MKEDESKELNLTIDEQNKQIEKLLEVHHYAMVFKTSLGANQSLQYDYEQIKKGGGKVSYHKTWNVLQIGYKPIKWMWYMHEGTCIDILKGRKWTKISFLDFEANAILKDVARHQLAFKGHTIFSAKKRIKEGLI